MKSLALTERNTILRDNYVRFMCEATQHVNTADRRTNVYLDECFIHQHYNKCDISLYDPNDDLDVQVKPKHKKHKGRRFCFIGAIVNGGPDNSKLAALKAEGIANTIILMDNAKYHKCVPEMTPKFTWPKGDLIDVCDSLGIPHSPGEIKASLWSKIAPYAWMVVPEVVDKADAAGQSLCRQYDTNTSFKDVEDRLDAAFESLSSKMVHGCILKAEGDLLELHRHICAIDND
ncbi:hypothetical protein H310_12699 [Aphanomyces invadans]|uniref:Uncharacterized protein n=1 Tax=Aphanomyces invadans TaxID=157072 RepID=A0A024TGX8_9STRA|nr:hypothetical protein H310_12699 [Aphanomyces invadans]ETV93264.1 hypothetical protein H310_12699 [Aphanomyces invadans]|eukprot:XP_008878099.1 hypothetical protein H310_12699 [Aphanomyces invadans]